jgi:RNA polymerase sigma factor (sigma-70 family)
LNEGSDEEEFREFVIGTERRLLRALTAAYGDQRGHDATAAALGFAWEHRARVLAMDNPVGYLFRVGQSSVRHRRARPVFERPSEQERRIEPGLTAGLASLSTRQRLAVMLVFGDEWTHAEVAELMGVDRSTVQRHLERGLVKLRKALQVSENE